jgi:hypothetical protein
LTIIKGSVKFFLDLDSFLPSAALTIPFTIRFL